MKKLIILAAFVISLCGCASAFDLPALQQFDDNVRHAKYCKQDSDCDQGKHCALYGHTEGACTPKAPEAAQKK